MPGCCDAQGEPTFCCHQSRKFWLSNWAAGWLQPTIQFRTKLVNEVMAHLVKYWKNTRPRRHVLGSVVPTRKKFRRFAKRKQSEERSTFCFSLCRRAPLSVLDPEEQQAINDLQAPQPQPLQPAAPVTDGRRRTDARISNADRPACIIITIVSLKNAAHNAGETCCHAAWWLSADLR